eukprot:TRINITY_DN12308_c0_g1_i1.p1 TRINITY_DN12308_c0_g1~~TRINITY_DN12308_c0_g1_i1.p1  ORF type:complete len:879 (+),score=132.04 TRINITY_DN12308_c0_g1_i1:69-2705(+)
MVLPASGSRLKWLATTSRFAAAGASEELELSAEELPFETPRLQSILGWKVELAARTAVAALISAIYAILPEVEQAAWNHATVFAPVLAIACTTGPSLGATVHHAWEMWIGTIVGCFSSMVVNETLRPIQDDTTRQLLMLVAFVFSVLFLCSRPWTLGQKRVSVGVMLCGTVHMSVHNHGEAWWYPWTVGTPCTVGLACAVISMLIPWPRLAVRELQRHIAFHAMTQRRAFAEIYRVVTHKKSTSVVSTEQLLHTLKENIVRMRDLLHAAHQELVMQGSAFRRLSDIVSIFDAQLTILQSLQISLRYDQGVATATHVKFHTYTDAALRTLLASLAELVDESVAADQEMRAVNWEFVGNVRTARAELDRSIFLARQEVMYAHGSGYDESDHAKEHNLEHCRRIASYFNLDRLSERTLAFFEANFANMRRRDTHESGEKPTLAPSLKLWFSCPNQVVMRQALKKAVSLAILSVLALIPEYRELCPEYMWSFIAASFIFSDYEGTSITTGLGRVFGTLLGGMFGLITMEWIDYLPIEHGRWEQSAFIVVCVAWTFFCSLHRTSEITGYMATVSAFSVYIMVVGMLESMGVKTAHQVVLGRMRAQFVGASIYVLVEVLLWPKSARRTVNEQQVKIIGAIRGSLREALRPYVLQSDLSDGTSSSGYSDDAYSSGDDGSPLLPLDPTSIKEGRAALAAAKGGLRAAGTEPSLTHRKFPVAVTERLLHTEEISLRLTETLLAVARSLPLADMDGDVPELVRSYAAAADASLSAALDEIELLLNEEAGETSRAAACSVDFATLASTAEVRMLEPSAHLLSLREEDRRLRAGLDRHFLRFRRSTANANQASFVVNTTFFGCLRFTEQMAKLAERLRVVVASETSLLHL